MMLLLLKWFFAGGVKIAAGTAGSSGDSFAVGTGTTGEITFSQSHFVLDPG